MTYYHGSKTNIINDLAGEIENSLEDMKGNIEVLSSINWNEIFEHVPNGERIHSDIVDAKDFIKARSIEEGFIEGHIKEETTTKRIVNIF